MPSAPETQHDGLQNPFTQRGANLEWEIVPGGDGKMVAYVKGEPFPRFVINFANPDILGGDGQTPPVSLLTNGGGGTGFGLPVYNVVSQYHADKTGATDAASAINQAISDANTAGGGIVWVPIGNYSVASADIVMLSKVRLWGENAQGSILVDNRASGSTVRLRGANAGTPVERCEVTGIGITGTNPGTNSRMGVELTYAQRCSVNTNEIANSGYGVRIYGSTSCAVDENRLISCGSTNASGKGAVHVIDDASGHSEHVTIDRNVFAGCFEHEVVILGGGGSRPEDVTVSTNQMLGSHVRGNRVDVRTTKACRVVRNRISMSAFDSGYSSVVAGVYVADTLGCTVADNEFVLSAAVAGSCVEVDATGAASTDVTVQGNKLVATALLATAMIWWHNTAPNYNLRGTSIDNGIVTDSSNNVLRAGNPNTLTPTHTYGPLNAREYGCVGDGVAYDGPGLLAWIAAVLATGRQGYLPQGTYLSQSDSATATLLVVDKATGVAGMSVFRGDGDGGATISCNVNLGADPYGNANYLWNELNGGKSQSVTLSDISFQGPSNHNTATINPNAAPIDPLRGMGVRPTNRSIHERFSVRGFHTGVQHDGQTLSGQFQVLAKVDGTNTVTVDTSVGPAPPSTLIGMTAFGNGIPGGTTVTNVSGNTVTLSANIFNAGGLQPLDLACYIVGQSAASRLQNTDHFTLAEFVIEECRNGLRVHRNTGAAGGLNTGTADFTYRRASIGRCQWAGIVASESGYFRDVTWDFVHVANIANSWLKEGINGIPPTQNIFLGDCWWSRTKSEGAGNYAFNCLSGLSLCYDWNGYFGFDGGIEINAQKTHKFLPSVPQEHTWKPFAGSALRDANSRVTITCLDSTVVAVGKMIAMESQNATIGGNAGDASFVDCGIVETIVDATHFTVLVGAQPKTLSTTYLTGATNLSVTGNPNIKNQDIGCVVTGVGIPSSPLTYVDNVNFHGQTFDLVDASDNPVAATAGGTTVTLSLPAVTTPVNIRFGLIGAARLGDMDDINLNLRLDSDPTTENIAAQNYFDVNTITSSRVTIFTTNGVMLDVDFRSPKNFASMEVFMLRGDQHHLLCQAAGTIGVGDAVRFTGNGKVLQYGAAGGSDYYKPYVGIARAGANNAATTVTVSPFLAGGQAPFVVANRPYLVVQTLGSNSSLATVDGGGVNVADSTAQNVYLVLNPANPAGKLSAWNGTTHGLLAVAISMSPAKGTAGSEKCDAQLVAPFFT